MKLTSQDTFELRKALSAAARAGLEDIVIHEGLVRGLNPGQSAAVFSPITLSLEPDVSMGIKRLGDLSKRLELFGDDILIEGELNDAKKVRRLFIRGKAGKIEFRCTDSKLIVYPKTNTDTPAIVVTLTKPEVALLNKGIKTLGCEDMVLQVKRDGTVHFEAVDTSNDRFEMDMSMPAQFVEEPVPFVHKYDTGTKGVLLDMLTQTTKDKDTIDLTIMQSGNIALTVLGVEVLAIPRITTGG